LFLLPNRTHPVFPYGYEQLSLAGHAPGSQNRTLRDKQAGTRKKGVKTKVMLGQKQGNRYGVFITEAVRVYSLIQRNHLHGDLPTKLNYYIFYYKYYCGHSTTSPEMLENRSVPPLQNFKKTQRVPQGRRAYGCSAQEHGAPGLLMQSRQLLVRGAAPEVWSPWPKEISSNFMNWST